MKHLNVAPVALVTGASQRIGKAIAQHLHSAGFRILIHCHHSLDNANALAKLMNAEVSQSAHVLSYDLTYEQSAIELIQKTIEWGGQLDLLVNNASVFSRHASDWDMLFTTNVKAPFWLSNASYPHLVRTKGSIINISDIHANTPLKGYSVYCQTKAALNMQTKALACEFAPHVRVNSIAPGAIAWPLGDNTLSPEAQRDIITKTPLQCHGDPIYIAEAVLSIAQNRFITGQILNVDGGRSCR